MLQKTESVRTKQGTANIANRILHIYEEVKLIQFGTNKSMLERIIISNSYKTYIVNRDVNNGSK